MNVVFFFSLFRLFFAAFLPTLRSSHTSRERSLSLSTCSHFSRFVVVVGGKIVVDVDSSRSLLLVYSAVTSPKLRSLSHVELSSVGGGES